MEEPKLKISYKETEHEQENIWKYMQSDSVYEYKPKFLSVRREFRDQMVKNDGRGIELGDDEINDAMMSEVTFDFNM